LHPLGSSIRRGARRDRCTKQIDPKFGGEVLRSRLRRACREGQSRQLQAVGLVVLGRHSGQVSPIELSTSLASATASSEETFGGDPDERFRGRTPGMRVGTIIDAAITLRCSYEKWAMSIPLFAATFRSDSSRIHLPRRAARISPTSLRHRPKSGTHCRYTQPDAVVRKH
jgi:hypothetical protein